MKGDVIMEHNELNKILIAILAMLLNERNEEVED